MFSSQMQIFFYAQKSCGKYKYHEKKMLVELGMWQLGWNIKKIQIKKNSEEEKSITNVAAAGFDQSNASFHTGHTGHTGHTRHTGHQQGWWRGSKFLEIQIQSIFKYKYKAIYISKYTQLTPKKVPLFGNTTLPLKSSWVKILLQWNGKLAAKWELQIFLCSAANV